MATLMDADLEPGRYFGSWDVKGIPRGIYYSVLNTGTSIQTRAIVIGR